MFNSDVRSSAEFNANGAAATVENALFTLTKAQFNALNSSPFLLVPGEANVIMLPLRLCVELTTLAGVTFTDATLTAIHDGIPGLTLMQAVTILTTTPLTTFTAMTQCQGAVHTVSVRGLGLRLFGITGDNDANIAQANVFFSFQKFRL